MCFQNIIKLLKLVKQKLNYRHLKSLCYNICDLFFQSSSSSVIALEGLVSPVIITAFNIILPFLFSFLAQFERFKTQSGEIKMTLFR